MNNTTSPAYLIDASIYIFRYYFSMPDHWWANNDFPTAAVYGYSHWLLRFIEANKPTHIAACFDESLDSCFRNEIYAGYKASRALPDDALAFQLNACKEITALLGVPTYASAIYEADDLLATLALRCRKKSIPVCIVSRDKDLAQIVVEKNDCMWDAPEGEKRYEKEIVAKLGVRPNQVADYLALVGDAGDDIPGVPGLGAKTAVKLLHYYSSWFELKQSLDSVANLPLRGASALAEKLKVHQPQIDMALQLTRTVTRANLGRRFSITLTRPNKKALIDYAATLGFGDNFKTSINRVFPKV